MREDRSLVVKTLYFVKNGVLDSPGAGHIKAPAHREASSLIVPPPTALARAGRVMSEPPCADASIDKALRTPKPEH